MGAVLHHLGLALSVAGLLDAGTRVASLMAPRGFERVVVAAVLASCAAALSALGLGLVGLGTDTVALCGAALATWAAARLRTPAPAVPISREAVEAWIGSPRWARLALGAAAGAWVAWAVWLLRYPGLSIDNVVYHLPEIVGWIGNGRPGSIVPVLPELPVGNYPLTNEVLVAWGTGIGRSFVWTTLWAPLLLALLAATAWSGFRTLRAPRWGAALGVAAICALPVVTHYQGNGANTDLPAITWLVAAAYLALGTARRPALLAPAVLAAGLAIGTKTTVAPMTLLVIGLAAYTSRSSLRSMARPLALAAAGAVGVGGYWYLRNFVDHGSPLWPFVAGPWGDAPPATLGGPDGIDASLLHRPRATLDRVGDDWLRICGCGFLLIAGSVPAAIAARTRWIAAAAAAALVSTLIWANSPYTGVSLPYLDIITESTVRYLLPALAAAVLASVLATASPRRSARVVGGAVLVAGAGLGMVQTHNLGFPEVPGVSTLVVGALAGLLAALWAGRLGGALDRSRLAPGHAVALTVGLVGAALAIPASGWVGRHAAASTTGGADTIAWLASQDLFRRGETPIAGVPLIQGPMAGDRLQHRFVWVPPDEACPKVRARARRGYVVAYDSPVIAAPESFRCLRGLSPVHRGRDFLVYGPSGP